MSTILCIYPGLASAAAVAEEEEEEAMDTSHSNGN